MKSKNCCHEVQQDDKFCKLCGSKVELEVKMKKCPSCGSLQHTYESACTDCKKKIIMCKGMKADGSSCETLMEPAQLFCSECGKKVGDADDEDIPEESLATGLAVICVHTSFKNNPLNLRERSNGPIDIDLMENIWNLYDCKVLPFMDEKSSFYDKKFKKKSKWCIV
ncbi:unnamed protein product [Mytilus edulis]|uniref:DZANK-type domain-containing protein n=1 Tax=Mytilus edulis TaxID=6550 RepID=A0A8S3RHP3_MYTED|nr:unnamed protein product [Mytilus edulis]